MILVAIVEDQAEIRDGVRTLLDASDGFRSAGAFGSVEEALARIAGFKPDALLLDIALPGMSGIEGIPLLREKLPDLLVLMLSVYEDDERIFAALCAGACGYLLKKAPREKLLDGLREACAGGSPMTPEVARRVVSLFRQFHPVPESRSELTVQEGRLLRLLVEGHHYKTAAAQLGISVNTVSFHLRHIYEKLQVHSKSEAVAKALRSGILR